MPTSTASSTVPDWDIALGRLTTLIPDELSIRLARLWLESPVWDGVSLSPRQRGLPRAP